MTPHMTCARCGGSLTAVPEGQRTKQLAITVELDRFPFLGCDGCECLYRQVSWNGYGINRITIKAKECAFCGIEADDPRASSACASVENKYGFHKFINR